VTAAVSIKEAASLARVHPDTLARWCRSGRVKARKLARGVGPWRVLVDELTLVDSEGRPVTRRKGRARR
jgi:predicted site-specific integrase-resolvase